MAIRFSQELVNQRVQTAGFLGLVDATATNNTALLDATDSALLVLQGLMGDAFQAAMANIHAVCVTNNGLLSGITTNLQAGLVTVPGQDAGGAALFAGIV